MGLPRIVSTEKDYKTILEEVDLPANGITLCSGSLGVRHDNDVLGIMKRYGHRVHFLHLRNVKRENSSIPCSFYEAEHLNGDIDMIGLIKKYCFKKNVDAMKAERIGLFLLDQIMGMKFWMI